MGFDGHGAPSESKTVVTPTGYAGLRRCRLDRPGRDSAQPRERRSHAFVMRGGHGHGTGHGGHAGNNHSGNGREPESHRSTDELRRQRDELDRQMVEREDREETPTVVGGGRR